MHESPGRAFRSADVVFTGTALAISPPLTEGSGEFSYRIRRVRFAIDEAWKAIRDASEISLRTGGGGGDCGFDFKEREKYVVYAHRLPGGT